MLDIGLRLSSAFAELGGGCREAGAGAADSESGPDRGHGVVTAWSRRGHGGSGRGGGSAGGGSGWGAATRAAGPII